MSVLIGEKEFFPGIEQIKYEGPESDNPLAFRWYDENKMVAGKTMKDYLKFSPVFRTGTPKESLPFKQVFEVLLVLCEYKGFCDYVFV
jgi:hypothetical protein